MALPNGAGGYQLGDGNLTEISFTNFTIPATITATTTLTVDNLAAGVIIYTSTSAGTLTLPTATLTDAAFSSAKVGSSFDLALVATSSGVPTISIGTGTGWSLASTSGTGVASRSVLYRAVKTGDAAYSLYRIAG
jgi:hypothetical protein